MEDIAELRTRAEEHRRSSEKLSNEHQRLMTEHRALVKKAKTYASKASNSLKMRDECAREASHSDDKADAWRDRHDDRKDRNALDLSNERNQVHMHAQAAKGMRVRGKRAESDHIKFKRMAGECNEKAAYLKKKALSMKKESNKEHELYVGFLRSISKLEKE
ncbi:MAG TPA: hypothetical protein VJX93_05175 [Candidatus Methanomethylophilaceae archaeon]|nr:hypothetical protein [Candidatus Methanomethylophilaceae archaeon]